MAEVGKPAYSEPSRRSMRMTRSRRSGRPRHGLRAAIAVLVAMLPWAAAPAQADPVRVYLPDGGNLQWMSFWVALGAGCFADERLDVELVVPGSGHDEGGRGAVRALLDGSAEIAVMPRPVFLMAAAQGRPIVAFANLLRNDPINLVVQPRVAAERGLSPSMPLEDRLRGLRGLRIGVAPGPPTRLRVLLASAGLDVDDDIEMVIVPGEAQNERFADGGVDAIYAHTPFLERSIVDQGGVLLVNQSAGEVPALANRQIHMLVAARGYANAEPDVPTRAARAVYRAQRLIHSDKKAAADAIRRSGVELRAPRGLETLIDIYEPAIPQTPEVSAEGALRELALFPQRRRVPELGHVDITAFVDARFAERAIAGAAEP